MTPGREEQAAVLEEKYLPTIKVIEQENDIEQAKSIEKKI